MPARPIKFAPVIAITLGDVTGIGPEVVAQALRDPRLPQGYRFEILGRAGHHRGKTPLSAARLALNALRDAAEGCLAGTYAAMVTGPVRKETMAKVSPGFVGQTEFLARTCDLPDDEAVMVLTDPKLTVALCTNHCSLKEALARLTPRRIERVTRVTYRFLRQRGIREPRLAFAGINPHLGEGGLFGDEDRKIVRPAWKKLLREGIALAHAPADTVFHAAVRDKAYDAIICAYHDQGLIPFKLLAFETGVNVTLGLPLIRTSPDHGTALEIAGQGRADHRSMLAAIRLACRLAAQRKSHLEE